MTEQMKDDESMFVVKSKDFQKFYRGIESHIEIGSFKKEELSILNNFLQLIEESMQKEDDILLVEEKDAILLSSVLKGGL